MKLKKFNASNSARKAIKQPSLRVHKNGCITLNGALAMLLQVDEESTICLLQDEEQPTEWYLYVSHDGFQIHKLPGTDAVKIYNGLVANELLRSCKLYENSYQIIVSAEPQKIEGMTLFALLTVTARR